MNVENEAAKNGVFVLDGHISDHEQQALNVEAWFGEDVLPRVVAHVEVFGEIVRIDHTHLHLLLNDHFREFNRILIVDPDGFEPVLD